MSKELLRGLPLFAGVAEEDLDALYAQAKLVELRKGEVLMEEGSAADALYVALTGRFVVSAHSGEREVEIAACGPGDVLGEIALLEGSVRTATVRVADDARLLRIDRETFEQVLRRSPGSALAVLRTVTGRLRNTDLMLRQSAKMAALGTLSAGLAHELNNPAASVRRGASQLRDTLAQLQRLAAELSALQLGPAQTECISILRRELPGRRVLPPDIDPLERSDREGELQSWLEEQGVDSPWLVAPPIVNMGWGASDVEDMASDFTRAERGVFARWLATACTVYAVLDEVNQGAERISEIVSAVKSYSHLDQAPVKLVDVHEGLENTLVILRFKLKKGVNVVREYAPDLPRIEAYAGELNQVWTNIVDNAVDAMDGKGELRLRTYAEGKYVVVEIADNGPGIPPDVQPRIFEAFFTTKEPGVGTGLGLHMTYNIVVHKHRGEIEVSSRPGETVFRVKLPTELGK